MQKYFLDEKLLQLFVIWKKNPKNIASNKTYRVQHPKRPVRKAGESFFLHLIYQMDYGLDEITSICVYA